MTFGPQAVSLVMTLTSSFSLAMHGLNVRSALGRLCGVVLLGGHPGGRSEDDVPLSLPRSKCRFVCWARTA